MLAPAGIAMPAHYTPGRKWRIRNARTREGRPMARVFELQMPQSLGVYDRYMSIAEALDTACRLEQRMAARGKPEPPVIR